MKPSPQTKPVNSARLNVIYFVCHDLGRTLGCYNSEIVSPNIDRFAASSVRFNNMFTNAAFCSPSRACAMTGRYAHRVGCNGVVGFGDFGLPPDVSTIVDYFNEAGYETAHFGYQHERDEAAANRYAIEGNRCPPDDWFGESRSCEWAENAVDDAIAYLRRRTASDLPFYLNIGTAEVHESRWGRVLRPDHPQNRSRIYGEWPLEDAFVPNYLPDLPVVRDRMARLQAAITFLDGQFGRLVRAISDFGLDRNTIVVFTTDHGINNPRAKTTLYDAGVEISFLMRVPGVPGRSEDALEQNVDVAPTLLEACGIDPPPTMDGRSFWPLFTGKSLPPHEMIFTEKNYPHGMCDAVDEGDDFIRSVRTPRYHYIRNLGSNQRRFWNRDELAEKMDPHAPVGAEFHNYPDSFPLRTELRSRHELYDIVHDPLEVTNLAKRPSRRGVLQTLSEKLDDWIRSTNDPIRQGSVPFRPPKTPMKFNPYERSVAIRSPEQ